MTNLDVPDSTPASVQTGEARARISAEWTRVGGGFTVAPAAELVDLEALVVRSAEQAPADARLFFVAASWVGVHHHLVDVRRLARALRAVDDVTSAIAGALFDIANTVAGTPRLTALAAHCRPLTRPQVLFAGTAADPWLAALARRDTLPIYARWGLFCDDVSLKTAAVRPVRWIVRHCPELRVRAVLGPTLDAAIVVALLGGAASVAAVARSAGATYAATHEAGGRLVGRGLLQAPRPGAPLAITPELDKWLELDR